LQSNDLFETLLSMQSIGKKGIFEDSVFIPPGVSVVVRLYNVFSVKTSTKKGCFYLHKALPCSGRFLQGKTLVNLAI